MARRKVPLVEGEFFHIYNRGNSKQIVFLDEHDCKRFVDLLYLCNSDKDFSYRDDLVRKNIDAFDFELGKPLVSIGAWVMMPNHFHLYVTSSSFYQVEARAISVYMHKLTKAYSQYFNRKYKRTGSLFEGKFKSQHIVTDNHAKYLFSYIHLNPVKLLQKDWRKKGIRNKDKALDFLGAYKWSSYPDWKNMKRKENKILNVKAFPEYFPTAKKFDEEILEWITYNEELV